MNGTFPDGISGSEGPAEQGWVVRKALLHFFTRGGSLDVS